MNTNIAKKNHRKLVLLKNASVLSPNRLFAKRVNVKYTV